MSTLEIIFKTIFDGTGSKAAAVGVREVGEATKGAAADMAGLKTGIDNLDLQVASQRAESLKQEIRDLSAALASGEISTDQARQEYQRLENQLDETEKEYEQLKSAASGADKGIRDSGSAAKGSSGDFDKLKGAATKLALGYVGIETARKAVEWTKQGAALQIANSQFNNLTESIGSTSDVMLTRLRSATSNMVSDAALVDNASQIMSLGLAKTEDGVVRLATASAKLGLDMQQLTLTMANDSTARLDSLGLSVEGVTTRAKELEETGLAKGDAFDLAVLEGLEARMDLLGDTAGTTAGDIAVLEASLQNLEDASKGLLAANLAEPISNFAREVEKFQIRGMASDVGFTRDQMKELNAALDEANASLALGRITAEEFYDTFDRSLETLNVAIEQVNKGMSTDEALEYALKFQEASAAAIELEESERAAYMAAQGFGTIVTSDAIPALRDFKTALEESKLATDETASSLMTGQQQVDHTRAALQLLFAAQDDGIITHSMLNGIIADGIPPLHQITNLIEGYRERSINAAAGTDTFSRHIADLAEQGIHATAVLLGMNSVMNQIAGGGPLLDSGTGQAVAMKLTPLDVEEPKRYFGSVISESQKAAEEQERITEKLTKTLVDAERQLDDLQTRRDRKVEDIETKRQANITKAQEKYAQRETELLDERAELEAELAEIRVGTVEAAEELEEELAQERKDLETEIALIRAEALDEEAEIQREIDEERMKALQDYETARLDSFAGFLREAGDEDFLIEEAIESLKQGLLEAEIAAGNYTLEQAAALAQALGISVGQVTNAIILQQIEEARKAIAEADLSPEDATAALDAAMQAAINGENVDDALAEYGVKIKTANEAAADATRELEAEKAKIIADAIDAEEAARKASEDRITQIHADAMDERDEAIRKQEELIAEVNAKILDNETALQADIKTIRDNATAEIKQADLDLQRSSDDLALKVIRNFEDSGVSADQFAGKVTNIATLLSELPKIVPITIKYIEEGKPPAGVSSGTTTTTTTTSGGATLGEFDDGGYTGPGARRDVAGIVHKDEFVIPSNVRRMGISAVNDFIGQNDPLFRPSQSITNKTASQVASTSNVTNINLTYNDLSGQNKLNALKQAKTAGMLYGKRAAEKFERFDL